MTAPREAVEAAPAAESRFAARYRVRFDESTPSGTLRTSALLRYAQDLAWMHSEALGFDRAWYEERSLAWLVRAAEVEVRGTVGTGRTLDVTTEVVGHRKVWARRRGEFRLPGGESVATVLTDWVLVDGRGRLARVPEVFEARFPAPAMSDPLLRVELPPLPADRRRRAFRARRHELDPVGHVNNAVYLDWLEEAIADEPGGESALDALPRRYRLEYAGAAEPGTDLEAATWRDGGGWAYSLRGGGTDLIRARFEA
jgi:acyl-ACP thioesterase